ncbi:MAG: 5-methylthioribose kinase [Anaerophaga sp.]|nr:5-methylthioribose kinase [Anaerophaga sp.]
MPYKELDERSVEIYVKKLGFFSNDEELHVEEVGDGNINFVFKVKSKKSGKSLVVKQALPYIRIVGDDWPLSLERNQIEAEALKIHGKLAPGLVPEIYHVDPELAASVMEDLSHLQIMRYGMIRMKKYPKFVDHISTYLANTIFYTSDFYMDPIEKKDMVKKFINPELCKITEDLIFTDPYYDAPRNNINPELRPYLESKFWKRSYLWHEASKLKFKFLTHAESLIHGDLHTGSIFADENSTKVFDAEFAYYGPSAFDPGLLIGNLLINYVSWEGKDYPSDAVQDYREYILDTINGIYESFVKKFSANWEKDVQDISFKGKRYLEYYLEQFLEDMIGYAAVVMIRRIHGLAHNIDIDEIEDLKKRRDTQIAVLEMATQLMMSRYQFKSIRDMTTYVKSTLY